MIVARKHIIAAIEAEGTLLFFPPHSKSDYKYAIKARYYQGKDKRIGEFGWTISVVPSQKERDKNAAKQRKV